MIVRGALTTALAIVALAGCGGDEPTARDPSTLTAAPTVMPPPPPPATASPAPSASAPPPHAKLPGCTGSTSDELQRALLQRATDARHCYVAYLTNAPGAKVSMNVTTRVFLNGDVGKIDIASTPSISQINECVTKEFEKGGFPAPSGNSCADVHVPIDFAPAP